MNPLYNMVMGAAGGGGNNMLSFLISAYKSGGNPMAVLQQLAQNNPNAQEFLSLIQGHTPQQMEQVCRNICQQRGINFDSALAQVKQMLQ